MDYIGSKEKINPWIFSKILNHFSEGVRGKTLLDACSGSGSTSRYAAGLGFTVIATDVMKFSYHITNGSIGLSKKELIDAKKNITKMNNLLRIKGFFYKNYSEDSGRLYLSNQNAMKVDAFRKYIISIKNEKVKSYLIYCILEAVSRVLNTTGVQAAFLKKLKTRALDQIKLREEKVVQGNIIAYHKDILDLLNQKSGENVLYIDPPYNARQYGPNYHLYETIAREDNPIISGKTGLRNWKPESKSAFCSKKTCLKLIKKIIEKTSAKYIYISYNSDGLLSSIEIQNLLISQKMPFVFYKIKQRRYKSDSNKKREYNISSLQEYLFEIIK